MMLLRESGSSVGAYVEQLGRLALAPFTLLRLAGDPALREVTDWRDGLMVVLHTLVAVPLVFGVIATSRFLRADWPFPATQHG